MSIAGKVSLVIQRKERIELELEGIGGESPGQRRMWIEREGLPASLSIRKGASIWGSGSSVDIQNDGEDVEHRFDRSGYTTLIYRESRAATP